MSSPYDGGGGNRDAEDFSRQIDELLPALSAGQAAQRSAHRVVLATVGEIDASTAIVTNVARTCAKKGYRTLVIDANLDEPFLHEVFGADNSRGLSTLLSSTQPPNRLWQPTRISNLALMTAGPTPAHGSSLLSTEHVFHRVDAISRHFDYVIVDCSRLSAVLAASVAADADSVIIFIMRHLTQMRQLSNYLDVMRSKGTVQPSVVIVDS
jgi:capsular exopolysaccharide synthesis family protein